MKENCMKKYFILLFLIIVSATLFCQDTTLTQSPSLYFFAPYEGQISQSSYGFADVSFDMFVNNGSFDASVGDLSVTYQNGPAVHYNIDVTPANHGLHLFLIKAGNYQCQGKAHIKYGVNNNQNGDFYTVWTNFSIQDNNPPSQPKNLNISKSANNHPLLKWSKNTELDLKNYKIYSRVGGEYAPWNYLNTASDTLYEDLTETYGTVNQTTPADYKITAVDVNQNESIPSTIKTTYVSGGGLEKHSSGGTVAKIDNYSLKQNYPNPFNPSTLIQYSVKEPGMVKLEVYNILGNKIRELVNEFKAAGEYNAVFDASNLPSGIYICKINVNEFSAIQKMSLLK